MRQVCWVLLWTPVVWASPYSTDRTPLPSPMGYVNDFGKVLAPQWASQIRSVCKDLEVRTGVEMIVVTVGEIPDGENAQQYADRLYQGWRIGTAQQERGILLLASIDQRQAVVILGRNLLSAISKTQLGEVSERFFMPMFREHHYGERLYQAAVYLAAASDRVAVSRDGGRKARSAGFWMNVGVVLLMVYILWRFTRPERRHPFQRWRRGEYWGTGQGGFRGNFGGMGGGMSGQGLG